MRIATLLLLILSPLAACSSHRYLVSDRSLDAWAALPRAERDRALVPAERIEGGPPVYIRGKDAKPLPEMRGDKRRVRTWRGATTVGIVLMIEGAILFATGIAVATAPHDPPQPCTMSMGDACGIDGVPSVGIGATVAGIGGAELIIGGILLQTGSRSFEVPAGRPGLLYLP